MPANTPLGYPYPLGTDRLMDGDDDIHALATAVEKRAGVFASGLANVNVTSGGTAASLAVTFPAGRFTAAPAVVTGAQGNAASTNVAVSVASGITAAGCTISAVKGGAGTQGVWWIAIQQG